MSCGCDSGYDGYDGMYGVCTPDIPYPNVSHESVPSLIDNLVTALYGTFFDPTTQTGYITKSIGPKGTIVWNIACDPNNTASVPGVTRNQGEGLLCYLLRVLTVFNPAGYITLTGTQTLTNKTLTAPVINGGTVAGASISNGTISGATLSGCTYSDTVPNASLAVNLTGSGATAYSLVYQTGANQTSYLSSGTSGLFLQSNGSAAPSWAAPTVSKTTNLAGGLKGYIPYQNTVDTTTFLAPGTAGYVLQSNGALAAPSWVAPGTSTNTNANNIIGGAAGNLLYQSSGSNTTWLTNGTSGYVLTQGSTNPQWTNPSTLTVSAASTATTATNFSGSLSGDVTGTQGSTSVVKVNGASVPTSKTIIGTNSSGQIVDASSATLSNNISGNAATATTATNLTGSGAAIGSIPWQSGTGQTSMLAPGTSGYVLQTQGAGSAPQWVSSTNNFTSNVSVTITGTPTGPVVSPMVSYPPRNFSFGAYGLNYTGTGVWSNLLPSYAGASSVVFNNLGGLEFYSSAVSASLNVPVMSFPQLQYVYGGFLSTAALTNFSAPNLVSISGVANFTGATSLTSTGFSLASLVHCGGVISFPLSPNFTSINLPSLTYLNGSITCSTYYITSVSIPNLSIITSNLSFTGTANGSLSSITLPSIGTLKYFGGSFNCTYAALSTSTVQSILAVMASLNGQNGTTVFSGSIYLINGTSAGYTALSIYQGTISGATGSSVTISLTNANLYFNTGDTIYVCKSSDLNQNGTFTVTSVTSSFVAYASSGTATGSAVIFGKTTAAQNYASLTNQGALISLNP